MCKIFVSLVMVLLMAHRASAVVALMESDDGRDAGMRLRIRHEMLRLKNAEGKAFAARSTQLLSFKKEISQLTEQDIVALFGQKVEFKGDRPTGFAFPVFESGMVLLPGLISMNPHQKSEATKAHTGFYQVDDFVAVQIRYGKDGETPVSVLVYFHKDSNFTQLNGWNDLRPRLAYDSAKLEQLLKWFRNRLVASRPKRAAKPGTRLVQGTIMGIDTKTNTVVVASQDEVLNLTIPSTVNLRQVELNLRAEELGVGDVVHMYAQERPQTLAYGQPPLESGVVKSIQPLTFGNQFIGSFSYNVGTSQLTDFATITAKWAPPFVSQEALGGSSHPSHPKYLQDLFSQAITVTVTNPERARFTRLTTLNLAALKVQQKVAVQVRTQKNGPLQASSIFVIVARKP